MEANLAGWVLQKMESMIRVQFLDKAVCFHFMLMPLGKGYESVCPPTQAMDK